MAIAGEGPIQAWGPALRTHWPGPHQSLVLENTCTLTGSGAYLEYAALGEPFLPFAVLFHGGLSQGSAGPRTRRCGGVCSEQGA